MKKICNNPCIRCGTERVVSRTWNEMVYGSMITNVDTICPDDECQKQVSSDNKKEHDKHVSLKLKSQQRALDRRVQINLNKTKKENLIKKNAGKNKKTS